MLAFGVLNVHSCTEGCEGDVHVRWIGGNTGLAIGGSMIALPEYGVDSIEALNSRASTAWFALIAC